MSDSTQQYITARPVTMDELGAWFTNEVVKEPLFQPLDIPYIEKQLEEIIKTAVIEAKKVDMSPLNEANALLGITRLAVAEIKALFGLEKGETE